MIGLVLVSHAQPLAEGLAALTTQMTQGKTPLAIAAGSGDPAQPLGTNPVAIMDAIEGLGDVDGVLLLMDLGSAVLSAETALELLDPAVAEKVRLSAAPLVEGALAAAVACATGQDLDAVQAEAERGLNPKRSHLGQPDLAADQPAPAAPPLPREGPQATLSRRATLNLLNGLHARPAAALVLAMSDLDAQVNLRCRDLTADARSLNSLACLNIRQGDEVILHARGPDAAEALARFDELVQTSFGETTQLLPPRPPPPPAPSPVPGALVGLPVSPGVARGPVVHFQPQMPAPVDRAYEGEAAEWRRLTQAQAQARHDLQLEAGRAGGEGAQILKAQQLMMDDPDLQDRLRAAIQPASGAGQTADRAWQGAITQLAASYRALEVEYLREREADVWDIGRRVMSLLTKTPAARLSLSEPSILVTRDLSASDAMQLDPTQVLGLCLAEGGRSSHSSILARAMGLPAIAGVADALAQTQPGQQVGLDAQAGLLWLDPDPDHRATLDLARQTWLDQQATELAAAQAPATTRSGHRVQVLANISGPEELPAALKAGAEGVGLLRTELLFQRSSQNLPSEEDQRAVYAQMAETLGERPLTIRSLDIGTDKPLATYPLPAEDNPALGRRGVRLCLADPGLFKTQLRAVLRAAADHPNIRLMIPMVCQPEELTQTRALLAACREELRLPEADAPLALGAMVELPAVALDMARFTPLADFFSIGTNDLTQYLMGADRGDPQLAHLLDYRQPAVLQAVRLAAEGARAAGRPIGMCGEMAADPQLTAQLLQRGLSSLSASAPAIPTLKTKIRSLP